VLVGHDVSGPDAIAYTLSHPERVAHLVLVNTYYGSAPALGFPEMIQLLADHRLAPLADAILGDPDQSPAWRKVIKKAAAPAAIGRST
jgi:haloalkane dehalogenase